MKDTQARSLVTIMMIVGISALFLSIAIKQIIKINIAQNESRAQVTLKLISAALENYAKDHLGAFPADLSILIQSKPPYLDKNYVSESPIKGYNYSCLRLEASGYSCSAVPVKCDLTGKMLYTITTGSVLVCAGCGK